MGRFFYACQKKPNLAKIYDVLNFSTNHAILELYLVDIKIDLPLSQYNFYVVPCDKEELYDGDSIIHMP